VIQNASRRSAIIATVIDAMKDCETVLCHDHAGTCGVNISISQSLAIERASMLAR
jgi:hypothetical protein